MPCLRLVLPLLLALALAAPVRAQEDEGGAALGWLRETTTARLTAWGAAYGRRGSPESDLLEGRLLGEVSFRPELGSYLRLALEPRLAVDSLERYRGFAPTLDERPLRARVFDFTTAEAVLEVGALELAVGKRTYAWGTADAFHAVRFFDARDYTELPPGRFLGTPSAELRLGLGEVTLAGIVAAAFTPSRFALPRSRWVIANEAQLGVDPDAFPYERELPARSWRNVQGAARAAWSSEALDAALTVFRGFQTLPLIEGRLDLAAPEPLSVALRYPRYTGLGGELSTTLQGFEVHAEVAARLYDGEQASSFIRGVVGANRLVADLIATHDVVFALEYTHAFVVDAGDEGTLADATDLSRTPRAGLLGAVRYEVDEDLRFELAAVSDLADSPNVLVHLEATFLPADWLELRLGADVFAGDEEEVGSFGRFEDDARAFASLTLIW